MAQQIDGSQALEPCHARKRPSAKQHRLTLTRREGERGRGGEGEREGGEEVERARERKRKRGEGGTEGGVTKRREWK